MLDDFDKKDARSMMQSLRLKADEALQYSENTCKCSHAEPPFFIDFRIACWIILVVCLQHGPCPGEVMADPEMKSAFEAGIARPESVRVTVTASLCLLIQ